MTTLTEIQSQAAKAISYALLGHILVLGILGAVIGAESLVSTLIVLAIVAAVPTIILKTSGEGEVHRYVTSASAIFMAAFFVFIFRGHPWQIDAHMYFFAMLAVISAFCDPKSIIVATVVTALHHVVFNFAVPAWVFPEGADFLRVVLHAVIVVLEAAVLFWATGKLASTLDQADAAETHAKELAETAKAEAASAAQCQADAESALEAQQASDLEKQRAEEEAAQQISDQRDRQQQAREDLAAEFESSLQVSVSELAEVSQGLQAEAEALQTISAESGSAMKVATNATGNVSQNVSSVASSAEEMSASVAEIARQVNKSTEVVEHARSEAGTSEARIKELAERADKINDVLSMIGEIAEQTNLLALNATIEAARAGDAGKGFAVVASEVKSLANQSAGATEEISRLLAGIREATNDAVEVNKNIVKVIGEIGENSAGIAAAVEEQSAATEEIARAAQTAAGETVEASQAVQNLQAMTDKVDEVSSMTANAVSALSAQTNSLSEKSNEFVERIRA